MIVIVQSLPCISSCCFDSSSISFVIACLSLSIELICLYISSFSCRVRVIFSVSSPTSWVISRFLNNQRQRKKFVWWVGDAYLAKLIHLDYLIIFELKLLYYKQSVVFKLTLTQLISYFRLNLKINRRQLPITLFTLKRGAYVVTHLGMDLFHADIGAGKDEVAFVQGHVLG